ncbi:MAG TPA: hypothetical protein EYP04_06025 [Anaerolineae bacterium]|nr:hypothetical protein [Anaerolineae bacterium]
MRQGDPTPFKQFRRQEYRATVSRMGHLPDHISLTERLAEEICLTKEVLDVALWLLLRGALVVSLSDKPDESTVPSPEMAAAGWLPLHRVETHVVGEAIAEKLQST